MRRPLIQKVICWSLLLYLVAFIIPPLSAFRQVFMTASESRNSAGLVKGNQHTTLYLYDLLIWKSLKKSKHTSSQVLAAPNKADIGDSYNNIPVFATMPGLSLSRQSNPEWCDLLLQHSRSADIHFARSGISPPRLS